VPPLFFFFLRKHLGSNWLLFPTLLPQQQGKCYFLRSCVMAALRDTPCYIAEPCLLFSLFPQALPCRISAKKREELKSYSWPPDTMQHQLLQS